MSALSLSGLSFSGLASGIDTTSIIDGMTKIQQQQITTLQDNGKQVAARQGAFKDIETKLLDLQNQTQALGQAVNGVFDARTATVSDPTRVTAAAGGSAAPGVFTFTVNQLAQAQQIASQGFDDPTSGIAQGTYQLRVGTGATTSVTIDGSNNTLQGLVSAVNNAGGDVAASIINDGSDARTQPFRLLLTAKKSGAANAVAVTFTPGVGGGVSPQFNATTINNAVAGAANTSTSAFSSNAGSGSYTGTTNNTYTFTVANGGNVAGGTVTINYADLTGANRGTITVNGAGTAQNVAQGLQIQVGAGSLTTGDTFTVDAFVPNVQQAADASVTIGSGSGALTVTSSTNQVNGLINGVSLNLLAADPTKPVTVTVANDTTKAANAVQAFVASYNALIGDISGQTKFDPTTKVGGLLLGNGDVIGIANRVTTAVTGVVAGLRPQINRLSTVGVTVNADATLSVDTNKLNQALAGQLPGVAFADVKRLFALGGQSTNSGIQFVLGTARTAASAIPYQVNVTQAATQGSFTATTALAPTVTINSGNNTVTLSVNGRTSNPLTLAAGTYTPLQLAQQLQTLVNNDSALTGNTVAVALSGGKLQVTSQLFGSNSKVSVGGGTALSALGLSGSETGTGQNVAGSFTVNGVTELAAGAGQVLTGNSGNAHTDGLAVSVTLTPAQVLAGSGTAALTVTRGLASALDKTLTALVDPVSGRLKTIDTSFQTQIDDINKEITKDNQQFADRKAALVQQFAAMEAAISRLKTEGQAIAAEFGTNTTTGTTGTTRIGG